MAIGRIPEPGTGIPESIIAAKGDLIVGTANDTPGILSVGTNGYTLVADSSTATGLAYAAPAGAGALTLISTTSFSAVSSQNLTNVFSTTYDNYVVLLDAYGSTTSTNINARLGASASFDAGNNYSYAAVGLNRGGGSVTNDNGDAVTSWYIGGFTTATSTAPLTTRMTIFGPYLAKSTNTDYQYFSRQGMVARSGGGTHDLTTSYTDFQLLASSGTITGTISIYGYSK